MPSIIETTALPPYRQSSYQIDTGKPDYLSEKRHVANIQEKTQIHRMDNRLDAEAAHTGSGEKLKTSFRSFSTKR
jgi:hypothetical protein